MGTNYYVKLDAKNRCPHCHREDPAEEIHIGKFSTGWKFCFNPKFKTYREWYAFLLKNVDHIFDEYDVKQPFVDFIEMIEGTKDGIWLYDPRYERSGFEDRPGLEYLDPEGYRFSTSPEFC